MIVGPSLCPKFMLFDVTRGYAIYRYFRGLAFFKVNFDAAPRGVLCVVGPASLALRMGEFVFIN